MSTGALKALRAAALVAGVIGAGSAHAVTVYASLFGDPRVENPDGLRIDVTITTSGTSAQWLVDINSPLHPDAKLGGFYFNMGPETFGLSNFSPSDWARVLPPKPEGGDFDPNFLYEVGKKGNDGNVTNSVNLVFSMTKASGGDFTLEDFLKAPESCSSDKTLGCGQLGAHLQSLASPTTAKAASDSGFLLGYFSEKPYPPAEVPIPAAAWLLGSGLLAMGAIGRRRLSARV
jgi:hypothetical protein